MLWSAVGFCAGCRAGPVRDALGLDQLDDQTSLAPQGTTDLTRSGPERARSNRDERPAVRRWYVPQELYSEYHWRQWEYTNYARRKAPL